MENLNITATKYTPEIKLDAQSRTISVIGKSYPANTFEFYKPVIEWLDAYFKKGTTGKTVVNMEVAYFNSSSSKLFFDLFDLLEESSENSDIEINWIYDEENESALEAGKDFLDDFENLTINLVAK